MAVHHQRMALVRLIHVWNQIGLPGSAVVFVTSWGIAIGANTIYPILAIGGTFLAIVFLIVTRWVGGNFDRALVKHHYPRIVALELLLDYQYYRSYLKSIKQFNEFVCQCEKITNVSNAAYVWERVVQCFEEYGGYSPRGRFVIPLDVIAVILGLAYLVISGAMLWRYKPEGVDILDWIFLPV